MPDTWIDRIFMRMQGLYGALFLDRWKGCDMANVKAVWADELSGFVDQPERIAYALKSLAENKFPPTLPEFISACRQAPAKPSVPALEHRMTEADEARAKQMAEEAKRAIKPKHSDGIDRHWATHPRSDLQMRMINDAAKKDPRFALCISEMAKKGICTDSGVLLKTYRDGDFYHLRKAA